MRNAKADQALAVLRKLAASATSGANPVLRLGLQEPGVKVATSAAGLLEAIESGFKTGLQAFKASDAPASKPSGAPAGVGSGQSTPVQRATGSASVSLSTARLAYAEH